MINIHHEVLPRFQGAQSVIWQSYEGPAEMGYTINRIDRHMETGDILYQEKMPIQLRPTLRERVNVSLTRLCEANAEVLVDVNDHPPGASRSQRAR